MPTIFKEPVTINGLSFNDALTRPPAAQAWGLDVCEGWDSTPDPEVFTVERANTMDGSVSSDFWPIRARFVTIGGYAVAASRSEAKELQDTIVRAITRNTEVQFLREEPIPKVMYVRRSTGIEFDFSVLPNGFRWQTTVRADDPFKYGEVAYQFIGGISGLDTGGFTFPLQFPLNFAGASPTGGGIGVENQGSAPTMRFYISVNGPLLRGAWRFREEYSGAEISFDTAVTATDTLLIDFANQTAFLNGYPISAQVRGDFFALQPGSNLIKLYADYNAGVQVNVSVLSAWE
jgi:hypothetical protein